MALTIGSKAPDFSLYDTERRARTLKEFIGRNTVLAFYPGAFTGTCTKEMCTLRDSLVDFHSLDAQVVGISVDAPAANKAFATANGLTFPLLSDYSREVIARYDVVQPDFGGLPGLVTARRAVFVLDKEGTIRYKWVSEDPGIEPNYEHIRASLSSL